MEKKVITYKYTFFSDAVKVGQHGFEYEEFMELFEFLVDKIYLRFDYYNFVLSHFYFLQLPKVGDY